MDDVNNLINTAIGGDVATQVVQGEKEFDLVVRLDRQYRDTPEEIGNIPVATSGGQQIPLKELADISGGPTAPPLSIVKPIQAIYRRTIFGRGPLPGRCGGTTPSPR